MPITSPSYSRASASHPDMIPTSTVEELFAAPVGRCYAGPAYVLWCAAADLQGAILWGPIDSQAIRNLLAIGELVGSGELAGHRRVFVDLRAIQRVDAEVLLDFAALARDRVRAWSSAIERLAIAVPTGIDGLLLAGALSSLGMAPPLRFFCEPAPAFAFLEHSAVREAHASATSLAEAARGDAILVARLHVHLRRDLVRASIEDTAGALGMSARSLQRALARVQTSFRDELRRVRVSAAEQMLRDSDLKVDAIACAVGYSNASHMSAVLRQERSVTATALRALHRRLVAAGRASAA